MKVEYIDHMGNDLSVVNAARVSFANMSTEFTLKADKPKGSDEGLINYLASHDHWTPFAHTAITLRMQAPIPVRTQAFKHKTGLVENEESRRYISTTPTFYVPDAFREKVQNKKQGSGETFDEDTNKSLQAIYKAHVEQSIDLYEELVNVWNVCEEQARFVLPQGCEVNWVWTGNLVSFANFVRKRTAPDAQLEIQLLAKEVSKIIAPLYPYSWEALTRHFD